MSPDATIPPGIGSVVGGCRIEAELGRGGMGVVYLAEQQGLRRKVALKVIAPALARDSGFRDRFERESRLAASIDHPNVVPVYAAGDDDGLLFIVMRYVRGTDLRAVLAAEGRLPSGRAARITRQIAAALDAAHASGLIHRDVKPGNVLLTGEGDAEHAYLSDFGLTKDAASQSAMTQTGHWVGTLDYVAPEQLESRRVDGRADIYALGCVLYETLAGQVPYAGTDVQKMWGHVNSPVPSLAPAAMDMASAFDPVVARAMAKAPDDRYPSAGDLGRAAVAAAEGRELREPERTVATGTAAPGAPLAARRAGSGAPTRAEPTRVDPVVRMSAAAPEPGARRRSLVWVGAVALAVLGVAAAVALSRGVLGGSDDDGAAERAAQTAPAGPQAEQRPRSTRPDDRTAATPPADPAASEVRYEPYTAPSGGYSTVVPAGPGWSMGAETNQNTADNPRWHVEIYGPSGVVIWIEATPFEAASGPASGVTRSTTVPHRTFGSADVYVFTGDTAPCTSGCVDYVMQGGESSGYAVLAGGGDLGLARRVAKRIASSMTY